VGAKRQIRSISSGNASKHPERRRSGIAVMLGRVPQSGTGSASRWNPSPFYRTAPPSGTLLAGNSLRRRDRLVVDRRGEIAGLEQISETGPRPVAGLAFVTTAMFEESNFQTFRRSRVPLQ
jgi:hypothetical protein